MNLLGGAFSVAESDEKKDPAGIGLEQAFCLPDRTPSRAR